MNKQYITTTLPYVNSIPHVGATLEFVQGDVYARYFRNKLGRENVYFNLGVDEHGLKVYLKAKDEKLTPQEFADKYAQKWKDFCKLYLIEYDNFYRTTDSDHKKKAQNFWIETAKKGDIYKKKYTGLYCVGCEAFKTEKDLVNGKCQDHDSIPIELTEENYFFRLSKYTEPLLKYLNENSEFISPNEKQQVLQNFVNLGLQDVSISRLKENLPWGIDVPNDQEQLMYVWFDALTNYLFAVGYYEDTQKFNDYWPTVIQICGPDNIRFQGALWQGMLLSLGIQNTKKLLVHGTITDNEGKKMSKSIGNTISPFDLEKKYSAEAVRFYLISGVSSFDDFSFSDERLKLRYNDALADKFGNLLNRVIHLAKIKNIDLFSNDFLDKSLVNITDKHHLKYIKHFEKYNLDLAFEEIYKLTAIGNQYITVNAPWLSGKTEDEITITLTSLRYLLEVVIKDYEPVIPVSCATAKVWLKILEKGILFKKLE